MSEDHQAFNSARPRDAERFDRITDRFLSEWSARCAEAAESRERAAARRGAHDEVGEVGEVDEVDEVGGGSAR